VVFSATLSPGLADAIGSGEWDGTLRVVVSEAAEARELRRALGYDSPSQ
jgi:hypothetical protein